jgi:hypothetical protein
VEAGYWSISKASHANQYGTTSYEGFMINKYASERWVHEGKNWLGELVHFPE